MKSEKKSSILKRIVDYEELKILAEDYKLDKERVEDNVINRLVSLEGKVDKILELLENNTKHTPTKHRNAPNSNENTKVDKLVEETPKVENKGKRRGRPKKVKD